MATDDPTSPYVAVRLRPFVAEDVGWCCVQTLEAEQQVVVTDPTPPSEADAEDDAGEHRFRFSRVFNSLRRPNQSTHSQRFVCNEAVWDEVGAPALRRCLEGRAATVLVAGHTGSGKSHSMLGHTDGMGHTVGHDPCRNARLERIPHA